MTDVDTTDFSASEPDPLALWVCPVSDLAGVARHLLDVASAGLPGWRVVFAVPAGPLADRLRELGAAVVTLDDRSTRAAVADLRRVVRRLQPRVVHSHLAKADFWAAMATPGLPVTLVSTEHHVQADQRVFHGSAVRAVGRQVAHHARIRRFDALIAVSESTRRDMIRHWRPRAPITLVHNGIDRSTPGVRTPGLRVLSLSRLSPEKNVETTLRAFARVAAEHPEATLTVAGEGPQRDELAALAGSLGVADRVDFPGFVDPVAALAAHDVLAQPSWAENFSYSLLDAIDAGLGVAASDIGGNPELLPARCLVAPQDAPELAEVIVRQGLDLAQRPSLPDEVPTRAQMTEQIVRVYAAAGAGSPAASRSVSAPVRQATPAVTVVTAYYRNHATLGAELDALVAQVGAPPFEVVIADNEGSALLPHLVAPYRDRLDIRVVPAHTRRGQCHARNVGVRAARAEIVALTDADDEVSPTWVAALHRLTSADDVLATGPMRLDRINSDFVCRAKARSDGLPAAPRPYLQEPFGYLGYERFVFGSNIGVRTATYLAIGGMNEAMQGGSEDVDFTWRLLESGRRIEVAPDAIVDYRLRSSAYDAMTQAYRYQRAQLGLWRRSQALGRPVRGMSLRWAVTETAKLPAAWASTWMHAARADDVDRFVLAARTGGTIGNLTGQLVVRAPWHRPQDEPCSR